MPRRQKKLTLIEGLVIMATLGILLSVMSPSRKQAQLRAHRAGRPGVQYAPARGPLAVRPPSGGASDGQLNTIRVSEYSQGTKHGDPFAWVKLVIGFLPVIMSAAVVVVILHRFRQQMTRRHTL